MNLKAFILGAEGAGKTELRKHLTLPGYLNMAGKLYYRSIAPESNTVEMTNIPDTDKVKIDIWDTSGNPRFKDKHARMFHSGSHFGLFCIDLSTPLTPQIISELENDHKQFTTVNPKALLFLVGTKSDVALPDALRSAQEQLAPISFIAKASTSAREQNGTEELFELFALHAPSLLEKQRQEQLKQAEELLKAQEKKNNILEARDRCIIKSDLFFALDKLSKEAQALSPAQIQKLGEEAHKLINILADINIKDKVPFINLFVTNCTEEIQGQHHIIISAILSIAYTATVAVIAALVGFGIGCSLGVWAGPGAFFSGLAAGSASAVTVVSSASVCGVATLGYSSYHFFMTTPVLSSIKEVAEKGIPTDLLDRSFQLTG